MASRNGWIRSGYSLEGRQLLCIAMRCDAMRCDRRKAGVWSLLGSSEVVESKVAPLVLT